MAQRDEQRRVMISDTTKSFMISYPKRSTGFPTCLEIAHDGDSCSEVEETVPYCRQGKRLKYESPGQKGLHTENVLEQIATEGAYPAAVSEHTGSAVKLDLAQHNYNRRIHDCQLFMKKSKFAELQEVVDGCLLPGRTVCNDPQIDLEKATD